VTDFHEHVPKWSLFGDGLHFCELRTEPFDGPLRSLHQPTVTRARGRVLIALSASSGILPSEVEHTLNSVVEELLDDAVGADDSTLLGTLQQRIWRMFQDGRFDRGVPDVVAVIAGDLGEVRLWRAGPNGIAAAENGRVRLLSEDLRIAAMRRLGGLLDEKWCRDPLIAEVSELTQIEPPNSSRQELTADLRHRCLLLLSRGAMPFAAPSTPEPTAGWWGRDAGWRHGLGANVIAIASERSRPEAISALSTPAAASNRGRDPVRR